MFKSFSMLLLGLMTLVILVALGAGNPSAQSVAQPAATVSPNDGGPTGNYTGWHIREWIHLYGTLGELDWPYGIALDDSSNVYVVGATIEHGSTVVRYDCNGNFNWVAGGLDTGERDIVSDDNYLYVTGSYWGNIVTSKYDFDGDTLWRREYDGPTNGDDDGIAIAVDDDGYVYVIGNVFDSTVDMGMVTIKYEPDGDTVWTRHYGGIPDSFAEAHAIAVDDSGYIYVAGEENCADQDISRMVIIKYKPDGDTAWVRYYNSSPMEDIPQDIAVDNSGHIYITGIGWITGQGADLMTLKFEPNGDTAWVRNYNGAGSYFDTANAVAIDDSGNVYVAGCADNGTNSDMCTIKYNSDGDTVWVRLYDRGDDDWAKDIAVGHAPGDSFNVYVTGCSKSGDITGAITTIKYDSGGDSVWIDHYNGDVSGYRFGVAIAQDNKGQVFVTGIERRNDVQNASTDWCTIKYVDYICGDANRDGLVNVGDAVFLSNMIFSGGPSPYPFKSGDANCDDGVDVADMRYLVNYIFNDGAPPCDPDNDGIPDC